MKILYTANAHTTDNLNAPPRLRPGRNGMRQLDGVPRQRLAANDHLRDIDMRLPATIANEHPSGHLTIAYNREADAEAAERLTEREAELAEAVQAQQNLQRRFSAAVILLQHQDADLEATTKRLTRREAELAEATETRLSLERQLAEAKSALGEAVRRSAEDRSTAIQQAAQSQSASDALLKEEVAKSDALAADLSATRQELARADTMLREAE